MTIVTTSIAASLGIGSGLDINSLVTDLANAAKQPKLDLITKRDTANKAKVSALGQVSNGIDSFASALTSLISGGSLFSQPSVSDPSVFTASAVPGARLGGLAASVEVRQLAQAQVLSSATLSRTDPVGQGVLTIADRRQQLRRDDRRDATTISTASPRRSTTRRRA